MTFAATCKEARALEQELHDEEAAILSQRVTVPAPRFTADMEKLKGQVQAELQEGLMGEMRKEIMEQMKALSANLMEKVRMQLSTREVLLAPNTPRPMDHHAASARAPQVRQRRAGTTAPVYQWDIQGRPICRKCGAVGHVQRQCPHIKFSGILISPTVEGQGASS